MAKREPLRAINVNSAPVRPSTGSVAKKSTPNSSKHQASKSALSGGAKRVKASTPNEGRDTITPKRSTTTTSEHREHTPNERDPHTPGYLLGTQSIKSIPLGSNSKASLPKHSSSRCNREYIVYYTFYRVLLFVQC